MKKFLFVTLNDPLISFMNMFVFIFVQVLSMALCYEHGSASSLLPTRLSLLHSSICRALVSEDGDRIRTWQKDTFHKKIFGGFKESQDFETGFSRAQKPWAKRLKKVMQALQFWG